MEMLVVSLRRARRSLWRHKGLSALAILCMGLGIGTCVTLFSAANPWLFRPLPYAAPDRLVGLRETVDQLGREWTQSVLLSPANYLDWRARARSFEDMATFARLEYNLSRDGEPERVPAAQITGGLFPFLGVSPVHGRVFAAEEDRPGSAVALIGHALWERRFGKDPAVLGRTITLDGTLHTIVGVMPPRFAFPEYAEVWTPLGLGPGASRDRHRLDALARLKPGISVAQAQADLSAVAAGLAQEHPDTNRGRGALVRPYLETQTPPGVVMGLYLLIGAGLFVQLIASLNVANLLLVKAAGQRHEIALRLALGAGRARVLHQFLLETLLLTAAGCALGVLLGSLGARAVVGSTPVRPPFWVDFSLDARVVAFTIAVAALSALLVGLVPALQARHANLLEDLKEGGRTMAAAGRARLGRVLVVSELAAALVLLIGAALMVQSFQQRSGADPGLDAHGVLTAELALSGDSYREPEQRAAFLEELLRRLRARPEVQEAGASNALPFPDPLKGGWWTRAFEIEGQPEPERAPRAVYFAGTAGHLPAVGIPLRQGRLFTPEEEVEGRDVAVVSETLAQRFWKADDPLGKRLRLQGGPWLRVVGVAGEVRDAGDMTLIDAKPPGQIYVPYRRHAPPVVSLAVRTRSDPALFAENLRGVVRSLDPALPVQSVFTLDEVRLRSAWVARMWGQMLSQVAALALILAALGVYGVVSYSVSQRTHEIGIRMAVGADRGRVLRLVLGDGMRLGLRAVAVGTLGALLVTRSLARLLHGVSALDPLTFVACAAALLLAALVASYAPAWRGTRVDPMVALRAE
jgi:predicted permease